MAGPIADLADVPGDALVMLVGAAGSGKSTLAARLFPAAAILSSDAIRAELTGQPADQSMNALVFRTLHQRAERRLAAGLLTVVDATNVGAAARRPLRRLAARHARPVVAIVLDLPTELCVGRNASRGDRIVPEAAVRRQLGTLRHALDSGELAAEGLSQIIILTGATGLDDPSSGLTKPVEAATLSPSALPRRSRRRPP
ncbi:MAG: AAA family ATPase [Candidatus Limnocylindrales bacterium]